MIVLPRIIFSILAVQRLLHPEKVNMHVNFANTLFFHGSMLVKCNVIMHLLDLQPDSYVCPQCQAPKKRFARYDVDTGKAIGGGLPPIGVIIGLVAGVGAVGALLVYGLQ